MEQWKRYFRYAVLTILILLSFLGIALPIPMYRDDSIRIKTEQIAKKREEEDDLFELEED